MANPSAAPESKDSKAPQKKRPLVPPDQKFWIKYSPHYELPLSGAGSFTLHALAFVLLGIILAGILSFGGNRNPLPVEPIEITDVGGGGGNPDGVGPGHGDGATPKEIAQNTPTERPPDQVAVPALKPAERVDPSLFPDLAKDPDGARFIEDGANQALAGLARVREDARDNLMKGLAGQGKGGPGQGGGKDRGVGEGEGSGVGPGKGKLSQRAKRVLRWTMIFDTRDGRDYLRQLEALGAFLGIPQEDGTYRIIRDLKNLPAVGEVEELNKIQRIFWIDNKTDSIDGLARALGLKNVPAHVVAFFPETLEADLLKRELQYRGLQEHQIKETKFRVLQRGNSYEPQVTEQR